MIPLPLAFSVVVAQWMGDGVHGEVVVVVLELRLEHVHNHHQHMEDLGVLELQVKLATLEIVLSMVVGVLGPSVVDIVWKEEGLEHVQIHDQRMEDLIVSDPT